MSKRFYITTAIDYVNGHPHLGLAYEKVVAEVLARAPRQAVLENGRPLPSVPGLLPKKNPARVSYYQDSLPPRTVRWPMAGHTGSATVTFAWCFLK
jgi:hypothetical protein